MAGEPPTIAADVYSLAAIALMMIGGAAPELQNDRRAGAGGNAPQLALPLSASEEEALRTVVGVEAGLLRTVMSRALSADPGQRPSSASALVEGLRDAMVQEHTTSEPALIGVATTEPPRKSYRTLALAAAAIAMIAALFAGGLLWGERDDEQVPQPASTDAPESTHAPPAALTVTPAPPPTSSPPPPPSTVSSQPAQPPAETKPPPPRTATPSRRTTATRRTAPTASAPTRAERQRAQRSRAAAAPAVDPNAPGSLLVTSDPPGAQLFVNDELVGTTPLLVSTVPVGTHRIRVQLSGFQTFSSSVPIEPGKRARVTAKLTP